MTSRLWHGLVGAFVLAMFWSTPAPAEWRRAESPNFIVYGEGSEGRLRERIRLLEDYHWLLVTITNIEPEPAPNKLIVYIVRGHDDLRRISDVPANVAGFYMASPYGIAAFVDGNVEVGGNEALFHEYAHHFMWQYAPSSYPGWYVEGFADYFSTAQISPRQIDIGRYSDGRMWTLHNRSWLPMEALLAGTARQVDRNDRAQYYSQSWLTVHFFFSNSERQAALRRYLAAIRQGTNPREALQSATGFTPATLERALRAYVARDIMFRRMQRAEPQAPAVTVTVLPRSADDLILHEAALRVGSPSAARNGLLERVRTAAARHGEDPYARRVLAHAEVMHGDRAAGERLLDGLLAAAPGDAELLYLKGMRYLREAEEGGDRATSARSAGLWFSRAHRANANHYQTLYRYSQSLRGRAGYDSDNTADILALAHQLAPQVVEISMNAAAMLISRRDFELAEAILEPLAANPHSESLAQAAQQMLEQARAARIGQPGPAPQPATGDRAQ